MQTINYQGQEIEATLVNYLSGTIPTSTVDADGDEELFRDDAGRYYLRRKLGLLADYHEDDGEGNIEASGRTHVHRISVNAAILWATTRLNSETLALRVDAASLLMEGRGYFDPEEREAGWTHGKLQDLVDSGESLTGERAPHLERILDAHVTGLLRSYAARHPKDDLRDVINGYLASMLTSALFDRTEEEDDVVLARRRRESQGTAGRQSAHAKIVIELDDLASTMLRKVCREGNACRVAGEDPRDLVNAAVTFYLCGDSNDQCGEFDLNQSDDALERAKGDRLAKGGEVAA